MFNYLVAVMCLMFAMPLAFADNIHERVLSQPDMRLTDAIVEEDLNRMQQVQKNLEMLDVSRVKNGVYHRAKAQALLDFVWDEYHENDRTGAVEAAFSYTQELIAAMQQGTTNISMKTRLLPGTRIVDQPLWDDANAMKKDKNFHCAQEPVAALEIQLLWAGHEYDELGWRHSKDQKKHARDLAKQANDQLKACDKPAPVVEPDCIPASRICKQAVAVPVPVMPIIKKPEIPSHRTIVYFDLDQHKLQATGPGTLNAALKFIQQHPDAYRIRIEAHTDRLATSAYNQILSKKRAKKVYDYLVAHGVEASIMERDWYGETRPVIFCDDKDYTTHKKLAACLQRNRRAEVFLFTPDRHQ